MIAARSDSDTHLLVGLLALQTQLVSRPELVAALGQWMHDRTQTLGEILVARRALLAGDLAILKALRDRLLDRHGGDVDQALAALTCLRTMRAALEGVADATLQACLARISALAAPETTSIVAEPPTGIAPTVVGPASVNAPPATAPAAPLATPVSPAPIASAGQPSSARFRKERLLLEGNLGSLYLARDMELARDVVVKQIHARYADDPEAQARFHREVKYASELEHAGIVPIYGAGCYSDGRRYYVMRYIKGEDLRAAIDRCHQLSRSERTHQVRLLVGRFIAVCRAIAYAHDRRVLHRDLKPENIRLSEDGETIVVDWGLAKSIDSSSTAGAAEATLVHREERECNPTRQFQAVGTPAYMSPEAAGGELDRVGPRSDVYSLGATLYDLLTGKPPFSKSEARSEPILTKVQRGDFRKPRELWPDVPRALEAICVKAMALTPEKRYRSAQALAEDLERWLEDEPVHALPDTYSERVIRRLRKRPLRVAMVAALVFTAVGAWGMEALHLYRAPVGADAPLEWQAERTRLEVIVAKLNSENEGLRDGRNVIQTKLERVQDQLQTAQDSAIDAQQIVAAVSKERDHWRQQHSQAVADVKAMESKRSPLAAELRSARTREARAQQQLTTLMRDAQQRFEGTYDGVRDAFTAFEEPLDDKGPAVKVKRLFEWGKLLRRIGDMYVLLEKRDEAETEYDRALKRFAAVQKATPVKAIDEALPRELAIARHNTAWLLVSSPAEPKTKYAAALKFADQAIEVLDRADWHLTRGMALYRLGDPQARGVLKEVQGKLKTESPSDYCVCLLFRAMIESRLGNREAADTLLREEDQRHERNDPPLSCELARFRREAEAVVADPRKAL